MPLLITIAKFLLKGLSLLGLAWLVKWQLQTDNADEAQEKKLWLEFFAKILGIVLLAASVIWLIQASGFLQNPSVIAALDFIAPMFDILKWPLIAITVYFVNWLIWALQISSRDDQTFMDSWGWLVLSPFLGTLSLMVVGYRNPAIGVFMIVVANILMLWGIYHQLPEFIRQPVDAFMGIS